MTPAAARRALEDKRDEFLILLGVPVEHLGREIELVDDIQRQQDIEVTGALSRMVRQTLVQVDAALVRLDAGTYGVCPVCGERIPHRQLKATPWRETCVGCADD